MSGMSNFSNFSAPNGGRWLPSGTLEYNPGYVSRTPGHYAIVSQTPYGGTTVVHIQHDPVAEARERAAALELERARLVLAAAALVGNPYIRPIQPVYGEPVRTTFINHNNGTSITITGARSW